VVRVSPLITRSSVTTHADFTQRIAPSKVVFPVPHCNRSLSMPSASYVSASQLKCPSLVVVVYHPAQMPWHLPALALRVSSYTLFLAMTVQAHAAA
jgi:hypothetical protein